jgi:hypothetical protein
MIWEIMPLRIIGMRWTNKMERVEFMEIYSSMAK